MYLKEQWIKRMAQSIKLIHPEYKDNELKDKLNKMFEKRFVDQDVMIYNSYENTVANTKLSEMLDWFQTEKPLIAESGVYFYPKHKKRNVNVEIIKEYMLDARTIHKAEKFEYLEKGDYINAAIKDIQQANDKKAANSGYGAEAQSSSFLYNMHSAMSVTSCGRGQLSTACQCFENLLADFVKFCTVDEFFTWVTNIVNEKSEWKFETFDVINHAPTEDEFVERYYNKFMNPTDEIRELIRTVYHNLDVEMQCRVFYKANIRDFLRNFVVMELYRSIVTSPDAIIDPNKVPEGIARDVALICSLTTEFVNYKHSMFRYIDRTKYHKRRVVVIMDTDSCFIYYGEILNYVINTVLPKYLFIDKEDETMYRLKVLNVLSCISSAAIKDTLWNYTGTVNIAEEDRKYVRMKNEFHLSRLIITYAKKSYIGLLLRQEAHIFNPPKLDVKGVNFFKSTASKSTSNFIYDELLMKQLLQPEDNKIRLSRIMKRIEKFKKQMITDIKDGDMGYLKRSIRVKSEDAYSAPLSNGSYKAVYIWNKIMPDKYRINLPATVTLVKVNLLKKSDAAKLEKWPEIYQKVIDLFDHDPEVGGKKPKGIKAIALPDDMDEVPDWVLAVIDVDTLCGDNMKLLTQLYRPLGMVKGNIRHNGNTITYYTNIVRL